MKTSINQNRLTHELIYKLFPMVHTINSDGVTAIVEHESPLVFPSDDEVTAALSSLEVDTSERRP